MFRQIWDTDGPTDEYTVQQHQVIVEKLYSLQQVGQRINGGHNDHMFVNGKFEYLKDHWPCGLPAAMQIFAALMWLFLSGLTWKMEPLDLNELIG